MELDNRWCVWDKVAAKWAGDEDWTCKRVRCQTIEEKDRFATLALLSVSHPTIHRNWEDRKTMQKTNHQEYWGPQIKNYSHS